MSTMLIVLIAVLIAYIIFMLANASGEVPSFGASKTETVAPEEPAKAMPETIVTPAATEETKASASGFKHPETGETAANPTNYRFAKRWIKDALVSEGLLDRRYSNNELNKSDVSKRVKKALEQFKEIGKYHDS